MTEITATKLRDVAGKAMRQVILKRERVVITQYGEPACCIVPMADVQRLEALDAQGK